MFTVCHFPTTSDPPMPFAYYGAKHGLARRYPLPRHTTVVEPFAGSAAYSVRHAQRIRHAILIDADIRVVDLWHELQQASAADIDVIGSQLDGERFTHILLAGLCGGSQWMSPKPPVGGFKVTPRSRQDWPAMRRRILAALPHIRTWEIHHGDHTDAPDIDATWFVDPPYEPITSDAGKYYRHGAARLDYAALGSWCRARHGFTIVCEQSPARWLPFSPLATQANGAGIGSVARTELIWRSDQEQHPLFHHGDGGTPMADYPSVTP